MSTTSSGPVGPIDVTDLDTFYGIVQRDRLSVWAADSSPPAWPAKRLRERYRRLALVYAGRVEFCRVSRASAPEVWDVLGVGEETPATFAFRGGAALEWPWPVGVPARTEAQYRAWLDRHTA